MTAGATAVVPVKRWASAKRRLALPDDVRGSLAHAFAADVLAALSDARGVGSIVVVSAEPGLHTLAGRHGAAVLPDPAGGGGLGPALAHAVGWAAAHRPDAPVVVVPADLPCLTGDAVDALLARVASTGAGPAFVPDTQGTGTTLLVAPVHEAVLRYGAGSAAAHAAAGCRRLDDADARLRRDVDVVSDLALAVALGVGPATQAAWSRLRLDLAG